MLEHYEGRPLILLPEMVQVLRGERGYTENGKDIAELGIYHYQNGRACRAYEEPDEPGDFSPWDVETIYQFRRACWEQGRRDGGA